MQKIWQEAEALQTELVERRRDLHRHPETGWTEFRTASIVIKELQALGYEVYMGDDALVEEEMMGLPVTEVLEQAMVRAVSEGADADLVEKMRGGKTGVVGVMKFSRPGKIVAFRFDMDCNDVEECDTADHRPLESGFQSLHAKEMHACGHDGHASIGLTTAKILMELKEHLHGTLKIIFQPAEEGVRGAKSICESGFLDDVDYIFAAHIMPRVKDYDLYFGMNESFATTKLDVIYHGVSTHAAESPQFGKNALLSAANCIINLHSIPRNSDGQTRVNVGTVHAGTGRNVVPDTAKLEIEVRGVTTELNRYMEIYARDIINACALMHDTVVEIKQMGKAFALNCDEDFMNQIRNICVKEMPDLKLPPENLNPLGGSDDFSYMMEYVQVHGGKATYMKLLTDITASPHNTSFNFNEEVLNKGPRIMASIAYTLLK